MPYLDYDGLSHFLDKLKTTFPLSSTKGEANGLAELDSNGKVPSSQLPSYVDDVLEFNSKDFSGWNEWVASTSYSVGDKVKITDANENVSGYICKTANEDETFDESKWDAATKFPTQGNSGIIYIDTDTNLTYRWGGSAYVPIASDLALGETSSTAYRGDRGAAAYAAAVTDVDTTPTAESTHLITSGGVAAAIPDISTKADKADTVLDTTLSRGRIANTIVGTGSFAFGNMVEASGNHSHAEGYNTKATANYSHAEGYSTTATGARGAHTEGCTTTASGASSHAEGLSVTASGQASHAEGYASTTSTYGAFGKGDHAEGYNTIANSGTSSSSYAAHAEGNQTTATSNAAHAEGDNTTASGNASHAEGYGTTASGAYSHAEGYGPTASGSYSHAEGNNTTALGSNSHAEGYNTKASGDASHAEGYQTQVTGSYAHAEGWNTIASYCQHVVGKFNVPNTSNALSWPTDTTNIPEYDPNKDYYARGSLVKYNNSVYVSHSETSPKRGSPKYDTYNWHSYTSTTTGTEPEWQNETEYAQNTIVKLTDSSGTVTYYQNHNAIVGTRIQAGTNEWFRDWHTQSSGTYPVDPDYVEIVGWSRGVYTDPRNIRVVDHEGNERLAGDLYIHCDDDSTGGTKVATTTDLSTKADKADTVLDTTLSRGRKANTTVAVRSLAFGNDVEASNMDSQAFGNLTIASGYASHSEGTSTTASGAQSHAEGYGTTASGNNSHTEGYNSTAFGAQSHAEGQGTTAFGDYSHAEGYYTTASGTQSHAEGNNTTSSGSYSHSEGISTVASGGESHAEGQGGTYTLNGTSYTSGAKGTADHSEGYQCLTEPSMPGNHAEGYQTRATGGGAHSEGQGTLASGLAAHAEGQGAIASGFGSHAEGQQTAASGQDAHAEGFCTKASGSYSHVSGQFNVEDSYSNWSEWVANTSYSVGDKVKRTSGSSVSGYICKTANSDSTFTSSKWTAQNGQMNYAEIIGNGIDVNNKSNARALDWDGNEYLKGDLYVGCNADSTSGTKVATATDLSAKADKANPVFTGSISLDRKANTTVGYESFAVGGSAEASGEFSHAEGNNPIASGNNSHAEGFYTTASGISSHAEGSRTIASGKFSHAQGMWVTANHKSQSAAGEYNVLDSSVAASTDRGTYVEIIGNGTADNTRSNARALDWDGNEHLKGDLYVNCNADSTGGTKVTPLPAVTSSDNGKSLEVSNGSWATGSKKIDKEYTVPDDWSAKTWSNLTSFYGYNIWTDGENIYYSSGVTHHIFDKSTSTWSSKAWTGLANFDGKYIWTDGENIYYSNSSNQYILNKSTSTWSSKTWTGLTSFYGEYVWTDGENIYYSEASNQYILNKSISAWSSKTWTGLTSLYGSNVWNDGENIYYSNGSSSTQYILDKSTSTWSSKTWTGFTNMYGNRIWIDGENIYYSENLNQYVLDKSTSTWSSKTWTGLTSFNGNNIWADDENIYYSNGSTQYKFNKPEDQILIGHNGEFTPVPVSDVISDGLPAVTSTDNGKILKVVSGDWAAAEAPTDLPAAPVSDGTYILQCSVSSGTATYSWVSLSNASGVSF